MRNMVTCSHKTKKVGVEHVVNHIKEGSVLR